VLVDVTETAKEAGIAYPTAVTQTLWNGYIEPPESLKGIQDMQGRLWACMAVGGCGYHTAQPQGFAVYVLIFGKI